MFCVHNRNFNVISCCKQTIQRILFDEKQLNAAEFGCSGNEDSCRPLQCAVHADQTGAETRAAGKVFILRCLTGKKSLRAAGAITSVCADSRAQCAVCTVVQCSVARSNRRLTGGGAQLSLN